MEDGDSKTYAINLIWGGKLPSMGDFVWSEAGTLPRACLDNWLQTGVRQLHLTLGNNWESRFNCGLLWNFIVPAGVLGAGCVAGCISPSCDRVGRRFPFVVAYGFSPDAPVWYLLKAVDAVPNLLTRTGVLLFHGIRRQWPQQTLTTLIQDARVKWQESLVPMEPDKLNALGKDSVILDVLMGEGGGNPLPGNDEVSTVPGDRFATLPWHDAASSLVAKSATTFWWTNGVGGAALKAFTYGVHLDGTLMTWLFGRPQT
ncbi:MAG: type VI secretion system-associated protein TagF [Gallionellaceae bacterium]|jgi:type VI secretion system protein ImpM|nr:type VI secretion system-associated protein TagF [Gallionellaceae bacterium]